MDTQTPVKKPRPIFDRRSIFFSACTLILFTVLAILIIKSPHDLSATPGTEKSSAQTVEQMRELANRLKTIGLADQAAKAFEEYLAHADISAQDKSKIYFSIGEMMLNANRYEEALSYLFKAEMADPNNALRSEIGGYIVTALERLGKGLDAEYQMESRTALKGEETVQKAPGEIIARIGIREITMGEINDAMEKLPPWLKEEFTKSQTKKLEFVQQYVANELLYDKGIKLGLHNTPEMREKIRQISKQLIVERVIAEQVTDKIQIDPADVKNYFDAHKADYKEEAKVRFKHIQVDAEARAQEILAKLSAGESFEDIAKAQSMDETTKEKGGEVPDWVYKEDETYLATYGEEFMNALFSPEAAAGPKVIHSAKGTHVVQVVEKQEARERPLEEVAKQVEHDYATLKEQRLGQALLMSILKSKDVQIYSDRFFVMDQKSGQDASASSDTQGEKAVWK